MSVSFYNRYVPPKPAKSVPQAPQRDHLHSKKRKNDSGQQDVQKRRKQEGEDEVKDAETINQTHINGGATKSPEKKQKKSKKDKSLPHADKEAHSNDIGDASGVKLEKAKRKDRQNEKCESTGAANEPEVHEAEKDGLLPAGTGAQRDHDSTANGTSKTVVELDNAKTPREPKRKKRRKDPEAESDPEAEQAKRHSKILEKYGKAAQIAQEPTEDTVETSEPAPKLHDFGRIPRPAPDPTYTAPTSTDSALPNWLRLPIRVPSNETAAFSSIRIAPPLLDTLQRAGLTDALPVQAGVLPHLLPTIHQHSGDVCISAATGSGKTLSYVLPILQELPPSKPSKLRGLVVVPTRELVDQVLRTFSMFASANSLNVTTAVGSHSLATEQAKLVEKRQRHDPEGWKRYKAYLESPADDSDDESVSSSCGFVPEDAFQLDEGHVPAFESRVDVLITTPGRLVEHIRHTRGFTLSHLQWLVIDEADRLLDQSFQEWADVVNGALSKPSEDELFNPLADSDDPWLRTLLKPSPQDKMPPRKVICSASMTRDLEKLANLRLRNPMSIVVEGGGTQSNNEEDDHLEKTATGAMVLPAGLEEFAVPVGDGSEKPLFLLRLLEKLFAGEPIDGAPQKKAANHSHLNGNKSEASSSSASSSDSDSDVSSDSDSSSSLSSDSSVSSDRDRDRDSDSDDPTTPPSKSKPNLTASNPPTTSSHKSVILIFTASNSSAARLATLLRHLSPPIHKLTTTLTKSTTSAKSRKLLASFSAPSKSGSAPAKQVLIATDRASRGLDIPGLTNVISYDVPHSVTSYVHRVGRTARAGKSGRAWTLLEGREAAWFWHVVALDEKGKKRKAVEGNEKIARGRTQVVRKVKLEDVRSEERVRAYEGALEKLRGEVVGVQ